MDGVGDFIQIQPHEHGAKTKAMIPVEMAHQDAGYAWGGNIGKDELPLGPLARIEQEPFPVPA